MEERKNTAMVSTKPAYRMADQSGMMLKLYALAVITVVFFVVIGFAIYLIRPYLVYVGYAILGAVFVLLLCGVTLPVIFVIRYATRSEWHNFGQYGSRERSLFGRNTVYSPMTTNTVKISTRKKQTTVTQVVPTLMELIEQGVITPGQLHMHMGFELTKSALLPCVDAWPGTFAIAGMGRSGKTRRVLALVIQAIIGRARVFICDPHRTKKDGLAKMLAPLAPWLVIARGHEECMAITRFVLHEFKHREKTERESENYWQPWCVIYDEFSLLMTSTEIEDEDKALIIELVSGCSTRFAGYNGFAGIIGQIWTDEACPTAIRRSLHKVFCHLLSQEYAKFFFNGKWANKASEQEPRQCLYRMGAHIKQLVTCDVPDDTCELVAVWLMEHLPPEELPQIEMPQTSQTKLQLVRPPSEMPVEDEPEEETVQAAPCRAVVPRSATEPLIVPVRPVSKKATLNDAIAVWNEQPGIGRYRLMELLQKRGLECSDDLAKTLIKEIKHRLGDRGGGDTGTEVE